MFAFIRKVLSALFGNKQDQPSSVDYIAPARETQWITTNTSSSERDLSSVPAQLPTDPFMSPLSQVLNGAAYVPGQLVDPTVSRVDPVTGYDTIDRDRNGIPDSMQLYVGNDINGNNVADTNE